MPYFECGLPHTVPLYVDARRTADFQRMLDTIHSRMEKLNKALKLSGLSGEDFSKSAKIVFDNHKSFDSLSAEQLANLSVSLFDGVHAPKREEWPNADVVIDTAFVSTREWEVIRTLGVGGSDAAIIVGCSPYVSQSKLYHDKVGTPVALDLAGTGQAVFDRGHAVEPRVIAAFCASSGAEVVPETRMFRSKKYPHVTANIDAIVRFSDGRMYVFEAKTTIADNFNSWVNGKIPRHYIPQMHQYPGVLDDDRILGTYIGCLLVNDTSVGDVYVDSEFNEKALYCRYIERDKDAEDEQMNAEEDWFTSYVERNLPPPQTSVPAGDKHPEMNEIDVQRMFSGPADPALPVEEWNLGSVQADIEKYLSISEEMKVLNTKLKGLDEQRKTLSLPLIEDLGQSVEARAKINDDEYYEIMYSPRQKTSVNIEALSDLIDVARGFAPPEFINKLSDTIVHETEASRVFSIKKKTYAQLARKAKSKKK